MYTPPSSDTALLSTIVEQAIELAAQWHDGTYRKSTWRPPAFHLPEGQAVRTPVMVHLTAAAFSVQQAGYGPITIAATFLHDILEDANQSGDYFSRDQLHVAMGEEVTRLVEQLTEKKFDEDGKPRSWKARKMDYLDGIPSFDPRAMAICLADKHHNLWSMNKSLASGVDIFSSSTNRKKLSSGPDEQHWFFTSLLEASIIHQDNRLAPLRVQLNNEVQRFHDLIDRT